MSIFTDQELAYLRRGPRLGRIATVGADGTPHVAPVGWSYNEAEDAIDVGGIALDQTKKYRDVRRRPRAALVIDELVSTDPWRVRGIEVRGGAEALTQPVLIRIRPERIISWGIDTDAVGQHNARTVAGSRQRHEDQP
jgi:pyridoxamine 5'-phosphate oxidase family protein